MTLEEAMKLRWDSLGKFPSLVQQVPLGDLADDHLKKIFCNQKHISDKYREAIRMILKDRSGSWLKIEEQRPSIRRREAVEATKAKKS